MKVKITEQSKKVLRLADTQAAREIIAQEKDDDFSAADYIKMAAECWLWNSGTGAAADAGDVLKASAEILKNGRVWNAYDDESGDLDVWLEGVVETWAGYLKIGCFLTDVWNIGSDEFNQKFPALCYARFFTEQE